MMMFFSNLWRVFRKRTFINVLFWIFHFRFEKNDSLHFTSLPLASALPYYAGLWCDGGGGLGYIASIYGAAGIVLLRYY
jgi:hypothetical protein